MENNSEISFLDSGSNKKILSKDWSQTILGPIENWSRGLRQALDICLESNSPIALFWGSKHIILYNQAYSKLVGDKHPEALGQPAREIFKKETWRSLSPKLKHVFSRGEAAELKDQHLLLPDYGSCCFDLSFSPIREEDGSVGGIFNIASETTKHRQVAKRREHIEKALQIETVGVAFFNLEGKINNANDAFLKMSGYGREDLEAGRIRWDKMTPPEWQETTKNALSELKETGATTPYEKQYFHKDGTRWWALFSSKYLEDGKSVEFVLDITERKRNEQLQKEQKRLLELIASDTPLNECLSSLCKSISQLSPNVRASIMLADEECKKFNRPVAPDLLPSFGEGLENAPINDLADSTCGKAVYYGKPVKSVDIANDNKWSQEWRDLCIAHDILACYSEPIPGKDNDPAGSLMLCFNEAREPNKWEQRLSDFGTHIARIAIERDQSDKALRNSKEKYQTLFESIDEGFCIIKMIFDEKENPVDYRFLEANSAFEKQSGLVDVVGKTMRQIIPEHEDYWFEIYGKIALTGEPRRFENYTKSLKRWLNLYAFRIGEPQERQVAVIFNDITEQKKEKKERERLLREVEAERERLNDIFYHAPSFMAIIMGPNHVFERVNSRYQKLVGERELIGKTVREAFPDLEGQGFFEMLDRVYRTGEEYLADDERIMLEPPSGGPAEEYYLNFIYQPLRDTNGSITGIFAQGIDLTDRKHAEQKLEAVNETLEERVEERTASLLAYQEQLRSLASQLSKAEEQERRRLAAEIHDNLGQMLAVAKMKADLLQKESLPEAVASDINDLRNLVNDALMHARELMSDLKPPPSRQKGDLHKTIEWLAGKMEKHNLRIIIDDDRQPKQLSEDIQTTLLQSVRELLFNIIKHAEVDEARVGISRQDDYVQVVVEDEGPGFDPKENNVTSFEKGGFGLFNISERMDLLGGKMEVISGLGKGTKVKLLAPLKEEQKQKEDKATEEVKGTLRPVEKKHKVKVLLADDHEMMREGLRKIVDEEDDLMVIAEASDGKEAVKLARELSPDIVVMDVNMPKMDGIDATQEITSKLPGTRVIGLSLHGHENVIASMRDAGASAYLTKNEAFETLSATIRSEAMMAKKGELPLL